jgi:hypothetical protein
LTDPAGLKSWPRGHSQGWKEKKQCGNAQPTYHLTAAHNLFNPRTHLQKVVQATIFFLLKQVFNPTLTQHSPTPCICETLAPHDLPMDSNNLLSLLITNQFAVDHHIQFENDERGRFARSRRAIETHDLELQAQIAERTIAI